MRLAAIGILFLPALFLQSLQSPFAFASGADDLLNAARGGSATNSAGTQAPSAADAVVDTSAFVLKDPFALQFYSAWQGAGKLPFEINSWSQAILKGQYSQAAHLWTAIQTKLPENFTIPARAGYVYCLWKLDLAQTFFDEWLSATQVPGFRADRSAIALEQAITPGFDHWLYDRGLVVRPDQKAAIAAWDAGHGFIDATLKGYAALRTGEAAALILPALSAENALKIPLSESVVLAFARKGDLADAARILKEHLEPALAARKDPKLLAEHEIEVARLLYQAGSLDGAETYYQRVPTGVPAFFASREELMWVWLRKGDLSRLRGELESLKSPVFADRFSPELYLVRAISNLKLCFYDEVAQDFQAFVASNATWAKQIEQAENGGGDLPPPDRDFYTLLLERAHTSLTAETAALDKLGQESVGAALPAVGWQLHWKKSLDSARADLEAVTKQRADEYRRQWRNRKAILAEAIRKMKFVKVEYLSQLQQLAESDRIHTSGGAAPMRAVAAPTTVSAGEKDEARKIAGEGDMSFPFDGTYWADEVFRLRAVTRGRCVQ